MTTLKIRDFKETDAAAAAAIFYETVQQATGEFYSAAQREVWAPAPPDTEYWRTRLVGQFCYVAEREQRVLGYMTLDESGYIDLAFVAPDCVRQGVGTALYVHLEDQARGMGIKQLTTNASHLARGLFEAQGWKVVREEIVGRKGIDIVRFAMEKPLE